MSPSVKSWRAWLPVAAVAVLLALVFLGGRPVWDPDEGRYTNVALEILRSGDWINLARNHETGHWTKPPLIYQAIAVSFALFGKSAWAARLPSALAYLLTVWLVARCARRLAPGAEREAALVFATMLLPFGASQFVSTDALLCALEALGMYGYVELRFGGGIRPWRWTLCLAIGFGAAFLTKGPPALLPLLAILAMEVLSPSHRLHVLPALSAVMLGAAVALPWFLVVSRRHPGLLGYLVAQEVVDRATGSHVTHNAEWYGWLVIYVPTLLVGTLPWTGTLARAVRGLRRGDPAGLFLALWVALPLLVFCVARSRLPLYLLPVCVPLALLAARRRQEEGRRATAVLALWVVALLGIKLAAASWPTPLDARAFAEAIRQRVPARVAEVVFVEDPPHYGLHLYLGSEIEEVSYARFPDHPFDPDYDEDLGTELAEQESDRIFVTKQAEWNDVVRRLDGLGYRPVALGAPFQAHVIFRVTARPI